MGEQGVFKLDMDRFFIYGPEPTGIWTGFDNRPEIRFGIRPGGFSNLTLDRKSALKSDREGFSGLTRSTDHD